MKKDQKISLCMMVKNEEKNLPRCLDSVKKFGFVDEIIIIDTGSEDKTIEIAKSYDADVIVPENLDEFYVDTEYGRKINFGKTRNELYKYATGDWILSLDADEELVGKADDLKTFLKDIPDEIEGVALFFEDIQKDKIHVRFPPPRIFRVGRITWESIVHNIPIFKEPAYVYPHLKVLHYGFDLTKQQKKEKTERTLGLLMRRLKDDPSDFRVYFYLAQIYGESGNFVKCIEYCIKYIRNKDYVKRFNPSIYFTLVQACRYGDEPILADKWLGEAIRELPDDIDIAMAILDYGIWQKKPNVVLEGAARFVRSYDALEVDKLSSGARFIYNYNSEALVKALFHLSTMRLEEGVVQLSRLKKEMKGFDLKLRKKIDADIERTLTEYGVNWIQEKEKSIKKKTTQTTGK